MDLLELAKSAVEITASGGFGAILGIAGSWLAKRESREVLKLQLHHEQLMAAHRLKEMETEAALQVQVLQAEADVASEVAAGEAFTASQTRGHEASGNPIVEVWRKMMRPLITLYLLVVVTLIAVQLHRSLGGLEVLPVAELIELYRHIIMQTVFLGMTATLWWFGSRPGRAIREL